MFSCIRLIGFFVEDDFDLFFGAYAQLVEEGGSIWGGGRGSRFLAGRQGGAEGAFDQLGAMDFHGREGAEGSAEIGAGKVEGFFGGFAGDQLCSDAGDGDGGLAAEGLEGGAVDDAAAILVLEFDPHAEHIAAIGAADGTDGVGVGEFAEVFGVGDGLLDALLERGVHQIMNYEL